MLRGSKLPFFSRAQEGQTAVTLNRFEVLRWGVSGNWKQDLRLEMIVVAWANGPKRSLLECPTPS